MSVNRDGSPGFFLQLCQHRFLGDSQDMGGHYHCRILLYVLSVNRGLWEWKLDILWFCHSVCGCWYEVNFGREKNDQELYKLLYYFGYLHVIWVVFSPKRLGSPPLWCGMVIKRKKNLAHFNDFMLCPPCRPPLQRPVTGSRADSPLEVGTHWQILLC